MEVDEVVHTPLIPPAFSPATPSSAPSPLSPIAFRHYVPPPSSPVDVHSASSSSASSSRELEDAFSERKAALALLAAKVRAEGSLPASSSSSSSSSASKRKTKKAKRSAPSSPSSVSSASSSSSAPRAPLIRRSSRVHTLFRSSSQQAYILMEERIKKKKEEMEVEEKPPNRLFCVLCRQWENLNLTDTDSVDGYWIQCVSCHGYCHGVRCAGLSIPEWEVYDKAEEGSMQEDFQCPICKHAAENSAIADEF